MAHVSGPYETFSSARNLEFYDKMIREIFSIDYKGRLSGGMHYCWKSEEEELIKCIQFVV